MNVYQLKVPVPDYYGDAIYHQELYIESENCPKKEDWIKLVNLIHERDEEYFDNVTDWNKVIQSINKSEEFPFLSGNLVMTSDIIEVTNLGKHAIVLTKLYIYCEPH